MEKYQDNIELEEMKQQIQLLKNKLAKETIISEKMIVESTREKVDYIKRKDRNMYILIPFALIYCNIVFIWLEYSWMFCLVTSLFLIAAFLYQIYSHRGVSTKDISTDNLVNISKALVRMNRLELKWLCFGLPFVLLWLIWFIIESYPKENGEAFFIGGCIGFVVGAVIGLLHLISVRRKSKDAIRNIEEYTKDE